MSEKNLTDYEGKSAEEKLAEEVEKDFLRRQREDRKSVV